MGEIKALSFDMYRTLLDSKDFHEQAVSAILRREGAESVDPDVFHERWDKLYDDVHLSMRPGEFMRERDVALESLRLTLQEYRINGDAKAGVSEWLDQYEDIDLFAEVEEVLNVLATRYPMVVVSNVDNADRGYASFRRKNLPFQAIITSETFKSYKPHGKLFQEALSILKCEPGEVLHIGDSQRSDVMWAKNAGMLAAWLNRRNDKLRTDIPAPDYIITNLRELLDL